MTSALNNDYFYSACDTYLASKLHVMKITVIPYVVYRIVIVNVHFCSIMKVIIYFFRCFQFMKTLIACLLTTNHLLQRSSVC
jgi:hypothetical protein